MRTQDLNTANKLLNNDNSCRAFHLSNSIELEVPQRKQIKYGIYSVLITRKNGVLFACVRLGYYRAAFNSTEYMFIRIANKSAKSL